MPQHSDHEANELVPLILQTGQMLGALRGSTIAHASVSPSRIAKRTSSTRSRIPSFSMIAAR